MLPEFIAEKREKIKEKTINYIESVDFSFAILYKAFFVKLIRKRIVLEIHEILD